MTSLAQALAGLGHRTSIYARKDSPELPDSVILARGVTVEHLAAGPTAPLSDDELTTHIGEFGGKLAKRWQRARPDIAHAQSWTSGLSALAAARGRDLRVVQSFGSLGIAERRHRLPVTGPASRIRMEACIARCADSVLAGTSAEAAELVRMGVPRSSLAVVPTGVDTGRFSPDGPAAERGQRPRLLAVAPLAEGHGLDILVRMLPGIPEAELVIAGGPPAGELRKDKVRRELVRLARSLRVQNRLVFTGEVSPDELPPLLRSADLLVSAAPYDPHGAITLAAMACGTPVAVTAEGANRDAVLDETTGLLVAPGRPGLLARRVRRLLAAPMQLEAFGIAAADRASARYSWDRIGRETAVAYERCLGPRGGTAVAGDAEIALAEDDEALAEAVGLPLTADVRVSPAAAGKLAVALV
jgi:glycosyltransferase involved in cell wall biosynthesis